MWLNFNSWISTENSKFHTWQVFPELHRFSRTLQCVQYFGYTIYRPRILSYRHVVYKTSTTYILGAQVPRKWQDSSRCIQCYVGVLYIYILYELSSSHFEVPSIYWLLSAYHFIPDHYNNILYIMWSERKNVDYNIFHTYI